MNCIRSTAIRIGVISQLLLVSSVFAVPSIPPFGVYPEEPYSPSITILESGLETIRFEMEMDRLPANDTLSLTRPPAGLWGQMNPTGSLLPRFSFFLALPPSGNPSVHFETWEAAVKPVRTISLPENNPLPPLVEIGDVGILGGVRIVPVTVRPIRYQNGAPACSVMTHAVIRIEMDDAPGQNPVANPPQEFSRPWQQIFRAVVTNWQFIPNYYVSAPSHILMIVPDSGAENYIPSISSFVQWKQQRGVKVTVVGKSEISSNPNASQVRARIQQELVNSTPRIDYVILVGDETRLPVSMRFTADPTTRFSTFTFPGTYTDEGFFAAVWGDDVYPDVFLGRWVVNTAQEVIKIAGRSIHHEASPFRSDSLRFGRCVVASDMQEQSQRETKRDVRRMLLNHGFNRVDTLWGNNITPQALINRVDVGQTLVNYRGQGWDFGWYGINFFYNNIAQLNNPFKLPIITGIGCGVGIFNIQDNNGFGEAWMLAGTVNEPRGAAGFIGPCWNTHTVYNDCLDSTLYKAWLDYYVSDLQPALVAGKVMTAGLLAPFLIEQNVAEIVNTMFRQYIVQGDPSLQIYTATPVRLQVVIPESVPRNAPAITVEITNMTAVPADSVCVTAWWGDEAFSSVWIARNEHAANVPLALPEGVDTLIVTLTGDNVLAHQQPVLIGPAAVESPAGVPDRLALAQNYPNPFNPETAIEFALPRSGSVRLEIFSVLGQRVATLADHPLSAGTHRVMWNGVSDGGRAVSSGLYYYRLTAGRDVLTRKMLLLR